MELIEYNRNCKHCTKDFGFCEQLINEHESCLKPAFYQLIYNNGIKLLCDNHSKSVESKYGSWLIPIKENYSHINTNEFVENPNDGKTEIEIKVEIKENQSELIKKFGYCQEFIFDSDERCLNGASFRLYPLTTPIPKLICRKHAEEYKRKNKNLLINPL